ncbi:MAG: IS1 family transposase [Flavobacteriaceae bacterium]|nr:IS1 family transposase [Flavobacteriaceae bacterium]
MGCRYCNGLNVIKRGKRNGIQRYHCKDCRKSFQDSYSYQAYNLAIDDLIKSLLREGCGVRSASRILNISCGTVLSRMLKISKQVEVPKFQSFGCKFEVDEMWTFIKRKDDFTWITYAIEQKTKQVIGLYVGSKSKETIKPLIDKILLLHPKRIYTDRLNIYPSLIPRKVHKVFQYCTNRIERMNLTLRTHIKRLSRRTICFSKDKKYLEAHLRIYFWG